MRILCLCYPTCEEQNPREGEGKRRGRTLRSLSPEAETETGMEQDRN